MLAPGLSRWLRVMPVLDTGIHIFEGDGNGDGRVKPGHDDDGASRADQAAPLDL
jgi:hypothetical protein